MARREPSGSWRQHLEAETRLSVGATEAADFQVPGLTILCHPDARRIGERAALTELTSGREALLSRLEPMFATPGEAVRRPLADPHLSRHPLRLVAAADGGIRLIASGTKTRVAAAGRSIPEEETFSAAEIDAGVVLVLAERLALVLHHLDPLPPAEVPRFGLVGESAAIVGVRREIAQVADLEVPVLLRGETGTGKELVANAIHEASPRRSRPFLAVNVGAIPPSLAAAELFGAVKGAYTGADRRRTGYFVRAEGGTLLLDEIGETPAELQVLLLRALDSGEIQPVGSEKVERVDVRVIAATDANLEAEVAAGAFRAPLLHRLSGYEIRLPPLRRRLDDFGRLLRHFLEQELAEVAEPGEPGDRWPSPPRPESPWVEGSGSGHGDRPWLSAPVVARLAAFSWPGNVRQLRNVARQLVIGNRGAPEVRIPPQVEELLRAAPEPAPAAPRLAAAAPAAKSRRKPATVTEEELVAALRAHRWDLKATAGALGISRTSLYALIEKFPGTRAPGDISADEIERAHRQCGGDLDAMMDRLEISRRALRRRLNELGLE